MREILVNRASPRAVALMVDGKLWEYLPDEAAPDSAQTVLTGRVVRVVKGLDAAFVDIGAERNAFLPLKENSDSFLAQGQLREGDRVLVQILREAHGEKGAFLTRDITLVGTHCVLMPMNRFVGVSGKLDGEEAERLRTLGTAITGGTFGLILRTGAARAGEEEIRDDVLRLREAWEKIARESAAAAVGTALWQRGNALESLLEDEAARDTAWVISDDPGVEAEVAGRCPFRLVEKDPLATAGVPAQLEEALRRRVWLKSGANLVIDECEALTVIDVNTAKFTGKQRTESNLTRVNVEACREIARQVRLRALGGIILIDMIDMLEEAHREEVLHALRQAFAGDRAKTVIHGFTSLGLIEMTRKRTRKALREALGRDGGKRASKD